MAAWIAIYPIPEKQKKTRFLAFAACIALVIVEIRAIAADSRAVDDQHASDLAEQALRFNDVQYLILQAQQSTLAAIRVQNAPATSLKRRALDLSDEILQFLVRREVRPGFGEGPFGAVPFGGVPNDASYQRETVKIFDATFEPRVVDIHDALKNRGLTDTQFNSEYKTPDDSYSIRSIAERIGRLAEMLPD